MADNVTLPGTAAVIASDEVGGAQHQLVKVEFGVDGAATPVSASDPLPVAVTFPATQPVSIAAPVAVTGSFYQATQPVSGSFYQATQPVSIAGTVAVSNTQLPAALAAGGGMKVEGVAGGVAFPVTGTFWQATQPVSIASMPTTPVTGTFWQATQPVSGTVALGAGVAAIGSVTVTSAPTTAVTGTFFQATQPVSLAAAVAVTDNSGSLTVDAPVATPVFVRLSDGAAAISTLPVSLASLPALTTGAAVIGAVTQSGTWTATPPTLTKGTQGANGFTTQDLKDSGRNARHFMLDAYTAAPVAEALQSVVQWYGNAAVGATTTPAVVPAGKTLRLTSYMLSTKSLATVGSVVVRVRANTAGLAVIGSPLVFSFEAGSVAGATTVAMTGGMGIVFGDFPDGFELPAGTGVGFTLAGYGPTGTLTLEGVTRFAVYGFEY